MKTVIQDREEAYEQAVQQTLIGYLKHRYPTSILDICQNYLHQEEIDEM